MLWPRGDVPVKAGVPPAYSMPYVMTGQQWIADPLAKATPSTNGFDVNLTGASAVRRW